MGWNPVQKPWPRVRIYSGKKFWPKCPVLEWTEKLVRVRLPNGPLEEFERATGIQRARSLYDPLALRIAPEDRDTLQSRLHKVEEVPPDSRSAFVVILVDDHTGVVSIDDVRLLVPAGFAPAEVAKRLEAIIAGAEASARSSERRRKAK